MQTDQALAELVETELLKMGVTPDYRGYRYLVTAVLMTMQNEELLYCVTTRLYANIAGQHGTTAGNVERSIRTAICALWNGSNDELLKHMLGRKYCSPPGNAKFIGIVSRRLLFKHNAMERERSDTD